MRISETEPSSVSLVKEFKSDASKVPNQGKAKREGVINPQNYNLSQF